MRAALVKALEFLELVLSAERTGVVNGIRDPACDSGAVKVFIGKNNVRNAVIVQLLNDLLGLQLSGGLRGIREWTAA